MDTPVPSLNTYIWILYTCAILYPPPSVHSLVAIPDQDYSAVADSVVLPAYYTAGDLLTNELTVPIRDDNLLEDTESFQVVLESDGGPGVELGSPHVMTILIEDNDCKWKYGYVLLKILQPY